MAEGALKKLEEQLQCAICLQIYSDPKLLHCSHAFCLHCIEKVVRRTRNRPPFVECPNCRYVTPIPRGGVASLQPAFQMNSLLEIQESLRNITQPAPEESLNALKVVDSPCPDHAEEELRLYCETCDKLICLKCAIKTGQHHKHSYGEIGECFEKFKGEVVSLIAPVEKHLSTITESRGTLEDRRQRMSEEDASVEDDIQEYVGKLHKAVEIRKAELLSELHRVGCARLEDLVGRQERMELVQGELGSCLDFMKESLKREEDCRGVLERKSSVMCRVRELIADSSVCATASSELLLCRRSASNASTCSNDSNSIAFSYSPIMLETLQGFGRIIAPAMQTSQDMSAPSSSSPPPPLPQCHESLENTTSETDSAAVLDVAAASGDRKTSCPDPSKCYVVGESLEGAVVGKEASAVLHVINNDLQVPQTPILDSISCELTSELSTDAALPVSVRAVVPSQYKLCYNASVKGRHWLHVRINGTPIAQSPLAVLARSPIKHLGPLLRNISEVKGPWGVAVSRSGEIFVSEHEGHCVSVFGPSGKQVRSFGTYGSGQARLNCPRGMAIDESGNVLVADYKNNRISKFTATGKFVKAVGSKGSGPLQFKGPKGIAFNTFNNMLYVTDENNRVQILCSSELTHHGMFGKIGSGKGQFYDPWDVACDGCGKVYVTDSTNNRVQVFAGDGTYLATFGGKGQSPGKFIHPAGIAVSSEEGGLIYISERYNHRVSVFNSRGDFLTVFGSFGRGSGEMRYPRGVAVDESGVVYVCDRDNNRVSLF